MNLSTLTETQIIVKWDDIYMKTISKRLVRKLFVTAEMDERGMFATRWYYLGHVEDKEECAWLTQ